jgi:hypothetical protein
MNSPRDNRFSCVWLLLVASAILASAQVGGHPIQVDDLLRPKLTVISRNPIVLRATITPRENVREVTVETPNNSTGEKIQCEFGALVANQSYECRIQGEAELTDPVFTVRFNGVIVTHGEEHLSSRSLSISNPRFDRQAFLSERKQVAEGGLRSGARVEQGVKIRKK